MVAPERYFLLISSSLYLTGQIVFRDNARQADTYSHWLDLFSEMKQFSHLTQRHSVAFWLLVHFSPSDSSAKR